MPSSTARGIIYPVPADTRPEADWWEDLALSVDGAVDEAALWIPISAGTHVGGNLSLVVPAGVFGRVKLYLHGTVEVAGSIALRVNSDNTSGLHKTSRRVYNGAGTMVDNGTTDTTTWLVGEWNTATACTSEIDLSWTDTASLIGFRAVSYAPASTAANVRDGVFRGRLNSGRQLTSIQVRFGTAVSFTALRWWLEGARG